MEYQFRLLIQAVSPDYVNNPSSFPEKRRLTQTMYKMRILGKGQRIELALCLVIAACVIFIMAVALPFVGVY
jgi:hypothetical protein